MVLLHGFATYDPEYRSYNLLLWNFSDTPAEVSVAINGLPGPLHRPTAFALMPRRFRMTRTFDYGP